jgi:hypothetical protein
VGARSVSQQSSDGVGRRRHSGRCWNRTEAATLLEREPTRASRSLLLFVRPARCNCFGDMSITPIVTARRWPRDCIRAGSPSDAPPIALSQCHARASGGWLLLTHGAIVCPARAFGGGTRPGEPDHALPHPEQGVASRNGSTRGIAVTPSRGTA